MTYKFKASSDDILIRECINYCTDKGISLNLLLNCEIWVDDIKIQPNRFESLQVFKGNEIEIYSRVNASAIIGLLPATLSATATSLISATINIGVSVAMSYAISGIKTLMTPKAEVSGVATASTEQAYKLENATNSIRPYENLPICIGKMRVTPDYAVQPYSETVDGIQYINHLFCVSAGGCKVTEIRNGTTPIENNEDFEIITYGKGTLVEILPGYIVAEDTTWRGDKEFKYFKNAIVSEPQNYKYTGANSYEFVTIDNVDKIVIELTFPSGLYISSPTGNESTSGIFDLKVTNTKTDEVVIDCKYQNELDNNGKAGAIVFGQRGDDANNRTRQDYTQSNSNYNLVLDRYMQYKNEVPSVKNAMAPDFVPRSLPKSTYKVEVTFGTLPYVQGGDFKLLENQAIDDGKYVYADTYISQIQQHKTGEKPIVWDGKTDLTLIEVRARATGRLNGSLQDINCMCELITDTGDNYCSSIVEKLLTDNTIVYTAGSIAIDRDSFDAFRQHCIQYGFTANGYETSGRTLGEVIADILEIAQAYLVSDKGVYKIIYDNPTQDIVDVITSRNSSNLTITQTRPIDLVDSLNVLYINKDMDYQQDELIVKDVDTPEALNTEKLDTVYITDKTLAYKYGMLALARMKLRNKTISFSTDWRAIDYKLGQKLLLNHNSFFYGIGASGKVMSYVKDEDGGVIGVVLDQYYNVEVDKQYSLRSATKYNNTFWDVTTEQNEETNTLYFTSTIAESTAPKLFSFVAFGETEKTGLEVLIKRISRNVDFTATIECIPATANYFTAITGDIPDIESSLTFPNRFDRNKPNIPSITAYTADERTAYKDLEGNIKINMYIALIYIEKQGVYFDRYKVSYKTASTKETVIYTDSKSSITIPDVKQGETYEVSIQAISTINQASDSAKAVIHVQGLLNAPMPPSELFLNDKILNIKMNNPPIDFKGYEVKISSNVNATYDEATLITNPLSLDGKVDFTPYIKYAKKVFAKTVDILDIKSDYISTNINIGDELDLNVVETVSEALNGWQDSDIVNGEIANNKLVSTDDIYTVYNGVDVNTFYNGVDVTSVFGLLSEDITYTLTKAIPFKLQGAFISAEVKLTLGLLKSVEVATGRTNEDNEVVYSAFTELIQYKLDNADEYIKIRFTFAKEQELIADDIVTSFDVLDKAPIFFINQEVTDDTLLTVPPKYFRYIKNVLTSLRYDEDKPDFNNAYTVKVLSKGTEVEGYISDGVTIACYDVNGNKTKGLVDVTLQGY